MEYKVFESIFKGAGFTDKQMKKIRNFSYDEYGKLRGHKVSTGGQRQAAYDSFMRVCRVCSNMETLSAFLDGVCKTTTGQIESLYDSLKNAA